MSFWSHYSVANTVLTLDDAVQKAQENDPWILNSEFTEKAQIDESIAAGALPDPMITFAVMNLPTDSYDFSQENMTQRKIGIAQVFPRGASRKLKKEKLNILSTQQPLLRDDRRYKVRTTVSHLWLEIYRAKQTIKLIEKDRQLFEHLVDVAQSNYSSAVKNTQQQDFVRALLELTRLEDRLIKLKQHLEGNKAKLAEWLVGSDIDTSNFQIADSLPTIKLHEIETSNDPNLLSQLFINHPAVIGVDKLIAASDTDIKLARQNFKPQWAINASYGYRDEMLNGNERSNLFSLGVSLDMPLFPKNRQSKKLSAAKSKAEAVKTQKTMMLRSLIASYESYLSQLKRLDQRKRLYTDRLLKEMYEQAEASLTAYTNDDGDFAEVVRSRIAELNAHIDLLNIEVDRKKTIVQIDYLLAGNNTMSEVENDRP